MSIQRLRAVGLNFTAAVFLSAALIVSGVFVTPITAADARPIDLATIEPVKKAQRTISSNNVTVPFLGGIDNRSSSVDTSENTAVNLFGVELPPVQLKINKTADKDAAGPAERLTYTIDIQNNGATGFQGPLVEDLSGILPNAEYNGDASSTQGQILDLQQKLVWIGNVDPGEAASIRYSVTIKPDAKIGESLSSNTISPSTGGLITCQSCTLSTPIHKIAHLVVKNIPQRNSTIPGESVNYAVEVQNIGTADFEGPIVNGLAGVLNHAQYAGDAVSSGGGSFSLSGSDLVWDGKIPAGEKVKLSYAVTVKTGVLAGVSLVNTVVAPEGVVVDCSGCSSVVSVVAGPRLVVNQVADRTTVAPGEKVKYTVTVRNVGKADYVGPVTANLADMADSAQYAGDAVSSGGGSFSLSGSDLVWDGKIPAGEKVKLSYAVTVKTGVLAGVSLVNTVVAPEGVVVDCSGCSSVVSVVAGPRLVVNQVADRTTVAPGEKVKYTVTVRNVGNADYWGSVVSNLSGLLEYAGDAVSSGGGSFSFSGTELVWNGKVAAEGTQTLEYSATVTTEAPINTDIASKVDPPYGAVVDCSGCSSVVSVVAGPRLVVSQVADRTTVAPGEKVKYTVTVRNVGKADYVGPVTANLADMADSAQYAGDAVSSGGGSFSFSGTELVWNGKVAAGKTVTLRYGAAIKTEAPISVDAVSKVTTPDGVVADCFLCATTVKIMDASGLVVSQVADRTTVAPGEKVKYTVTVRNVGKADYVGPVTANLADMADSAQYAGDAVSSGGGSFSFSGTELVWNGKVAIGQTVSFTYSTRVKDGAKPRSKLSATVVAPEGVVVDCSGCSSVVSVVAGPRLVVSQVADRTTVVPGEKVKYTVTVRNVGNADYIGPIVSNLLNVGIEQVNYNGGMTSTVGGSFNMVADNLVWIGKIVRGKTATLTYTVSVIDEALIGTTLSNIAAASKNATTDCSQCRATTKVVTSPYLKIVKTADKTAAAPGEKIVYTIKVTNNGTADFTGSIVDKITNLGGSVDYNSDAKRTHNTGQKDGAPQLGAKLLVSPRGGVAGLEWQGVQLAAKGGSATLTYSVTANTRAAAGGKLANTVEAPADVMTECSLCTTVVELVKPPVPQVKIVQKSDKDDKKQVKPGEKINYTVELSSNSEIDVEGEIVVEIAGLTKYATYNKDATQVRGNGTLRLGNDYNLVWAGKLKAKPAITAFGAAPKTILNYSVTVKENTPEGVKLTNPIRSLGNSVFECVGCDTALMVVRPQADSPSLKIRKTSDKTTVAPGDTITYTVTIVNGEEPTFATGGPFSGSVTDDMSGVVSNADYNNDAKASAGSVRFTSPNLVWSGDIPDASSVTVTYSVKVKDSAADGSSLVNRVAAPDGVETDCSQCETTVKVQESPRLKISKAPDKTTVDPGDTVTYTVTIANNGAGPFSGSVTDDMSGVVSNADYNNDAKASAGSVRFTSPNLVWSGDIPDASSVTVTYSVKVKDSAADGSSLVNRVAAPDGVETDCSQCEATVKVQKSAPDAPNLKIRKTSDKTTVAPGDTITYTVTIVNGEEPTFATGGPFSGSVTDDMSGVVSNADYNNDAKASAGSVRFTSPNLVWSGDIPDASSVTVTYSVKVKDSAADGSSLVNRVAAPDGVETDCSQCEATVKVQETATAEGLTIVKVADKATAVPGDTVTYTVTLSNNGGPFSGSVTDDMSDVVSNADYNNDAKASAGDVKFTSPNLVWTGDIPDGGSVTVTYSVKVKDGVAEGTKLVNKVAAPDGVETDCTKCEVEVNVLNPTEQNVRIIKVADKATAIPGDRVTYTITIVNNGAGAFSGSVTDDMSDVVSNALYCRDAKASAGDVKFTSPNLVWTGDIPDGGSVTVTYSVKVKDGVAEDTELVNKIVNNPSSPVDCSQCIVTVKVTGKTDPNNPDPNNPDPNNPDPNNPDPNNPDPNNPNKNLNGGGDGKEPDDGGGFPDTDPGNQGGDEDADEAEDSELSGLANSGASSFGTIAALVGLLLLGAEGTVLIVFRRRRQNG